MSSNGWHGKEWLDRVAMKRRDDRKVKFAGGMVIVLFWLAGWSTPDSACAQMSVESLVRDLGADDYLARETAQRTLKSRGAEALEPLLERLGSDDPEVAWRVADLLEQISVETGDPSKVQQVVERMTNVPGQLRQEFAARGLRLRSAIQKLRSEQAIQRLQRFGATVIASRSLGLAMGTRNELDPVAMDPLMDDLEEAEPTEVANEWGGAAPNSSGSDSPSSLGGDGLPAKYVSIEPLWDAGRWSILDVAKLEEDSDDLKGHQLDNGAQVIQINQLGGFRVAANAEIAQVIINQAGRPRPNTDLDGASHLAVLRSVVIDERWSGADEDYSLLSEVEGLAKLQVNGRPISATALEAVSEIYGLQVLELSRCDVDFASLMVLKEKHAHLQLEVHATARMGVFGGVGPNGETGCWVESVISGAPAAKAGLKPNDHLLSVDGHAIRDFAELSLYVSLMAPGDLLRFEVLRGEERLELSVELERREQR
jgi:hypothetical protein